MSEKETKVELDPAFDPFKTRAKKSTNVKKMIAVVSGKGGVGKSTVAALLASHAAKDGYQVGVIDGDIVGPSMGHLFNIHHPVFGTKEGIDPAISDAGVKVMTSNMLVENETTPILWRGALITNAVKDFYSEVLWGDLDLMVVDMPPGTGDIALTVFQSLPISGIIIVTSPQDLVTMIVSKAVEMAHKMNVPVLGIIENMAYMEHNGERLFPFGEPKSENLAASYDIPLLAQLPIDPQLVKLADAGDIESYDSEDFHWLVETILGA